MTPILSSSPPSYISEEPPNLFSSQNRNMDYVTLSGITERTGIGKENLRKFVSKELLDNAADFIERQQQQGEASKQKEKRSDSDEITVSIDIKPPHYLVLKVRNSNNNNCNPDNHRPFDKKMLEDIFDFGKYHSSKRNQFTVSRGALGDAFKEILACTYVLAKDLDKEDWNEPLIIITSTTRYDIRLQIDRINQTVNSIISESDFSSPTSSSDSDHDSSSCEKVRNFTEIEVHFPLPKEYNIEESLEYLPDLYNYIIEYSFINLHLSFVIKIENSDIVRFLKVQQILYLPAQLQRTVSKNIGITSIYYYTYSEFQNFIDGLAVENNSMLVYNLLQLKFREGARVKRTDLLSSLTVGQLKLNKNNETKAVYQTIKEAMNPPVIDTDAAKKKLLALPFDINKGARKEALRQRIQNCGTEIVGIKYDYITGYYSEQDEKFPFIFEIAVIESSEKLKKRLWFIESVNSSLPISENFIFESNQDIFAWNIRGSENVNIENGVYWILNKYGYSYQKDDCKKPYNIVIANLISPKITFKDYSKSRIVLEPFAEDIAQTAYKVAAFSSPSSTANKYKKLSIIDFERRLLHNRYEQIKLNPEIKETNTWTQSTVFYYLRPILEKAGIKIGKTTRKTIQGQYIKIICKEFGVTRAELGIVAADRAQMYFKGRWYDVGIDELNTLMHFGVDVLIIEKEGVAQTLCNFADEYGIALVNTRGFLTENVSILSKLVKGADGNVAILTDFDISGMLIAIKAPKNIPRIGIDFQTLEYFGINSPSSLRELEENYQPEESHLKAVEKYVDNLMENELEDPYDLVSNINYLRHKRIEIDSVTKLVGNAEFWKFIINKLKQAFPTRNYNRAIDIPSHVIPEPLEMLTNLVEKKVTKILEPYVKEHKRRLENYKGFAPVRKHEEAIVRDFKDIVDNNKDESIAELLDDVLNIVIKYDNEDDKPSA